MKQEKNSDALKLEIGCSSFEVISHWKINDL